MRYLGHLSADDPLYGYLRDDIFPQIGVHARSPGFRVYQLPSSNDVYLYEDEQTRRGSLENFSAACPVWTRTATRHMDREFSNLTYLRSLGFTGYPHYVARPLGRNASLNNVLVEEFCYGTSFATFIINAIRNGARDVLFEKLAALAYFLATLHNRTVHEHTVDFTKDCAYFDHILKNLHDAGVPDRMKSGNFGNSKKIGSARAACGKIGKSSFTVMSLRPTSFSATACG